MPTPTDKPQPTTGSRPAPGGDSAASLCSPIAREPWLIDTVVAVRAPAVVIAARDGQIYPIDHKGYPTAYGYYDQDRRLLSLCELTVDEVSPERLRHELVGSAASRHVCVVRTRNDPTPDPVLVVERLHGAGTGERITIRSRDAVTRGLRIELRLAADLADVSEVRRGQSGSRTRLDWKPSEPGLLWWTDEEDGAVVKLRLDPAPDHLELRDAPVAVVQWHATVEPGGQWSAGFTLETTADAPTLHPLQAVTVENPWIEPSASSDKRLDALAKQGLADLRALFLAPSDAPRDVFVAAGAPWYLTLFGRDSLWTARFLLPVDRDCELAYGTLRVLASMQGVRDDPETDEQPGKILHELRRRTTEHQQGQILPPVYYGSMDSTALFVLLLVEAYQSGLAADKVVGLIPNARAALAWMRRHTEANRAGFLRYEAARPGALVNHGWKDSVDSIISFDGLPAEGPVALCEVQAYAIQAANGFADLLQSLQGVEADREADELRTWADGLQRRFQQKFRVPLTGGHSYYAMALDGGDKVVDGLTSNMGHLLGTGTLDHAQSAEVARHLVSEELFSGWGVRTRGLHHSRYNPFSYHGGAVWTHDTAIAIRGLAMAAQAAFKAGDTASARECADAAWRLAQGLLSTAEQFEFRLPELCSGDGDGDGDDGATAPSPFPAACRPQAWSAAAGIAVLDALQRIRPLPSGSR